MFDMNKGVKELFKSLGKKLWIFIRHHFRNNPNRASIAITDQVIIDSRSHTFWEKMMSEDDALVATQVLERLIKYNRPVKEADIRNEFAKFGNQYSWIMLNWLSEPNFNKNLQLFNKRKEQVKTIPIDEFIEQNFPLTYKRFVKTMLKTSHASILEIIQAMHPNIDLTELVNLGSNADHIGPYSLVFSEILRMYKYSAY